MAAQRRASSKDLKGGSWRPALTAGAAAIALLAAPTLPGLRWPPDGMSRAQPTGPLTLTHVGDARGSLVAVISADTHAVIGQAGGRVRLRCFGPEDQVLSDRLVQLPPTDRWAPDPAAVDMPMTPQALALVRWCEAQADGVNPFGALLNSEESQSLGLR